MANMVEIELTQRQVHLLLACLKIAELEFIDNQEWVASANTNRLHQSLHRQIFTYGQITEEDSE